MATTSQALDIKQFQWIETQTSDPDRIALLSMREAVCQRNPAYTYLEVGSHLGGSLQPHVIDPRCKKIFSIDPRPQEQPDERWAENFRYDGNSTQRMLDQLQKIPGAELNKLSTFESSSWEVAENAIPASVDIAFIDGEHVDRTVIRDFHAVSRFMAASSLISFHDSFVVPGAILRIRSDLRRSGKKHSFYYYPESSIVAVTFDPDRFTDALTGFGWTTNLPLSRWPGVKMKLARTFPRAWSGARKIKRLVLPA